MTVPLAHKVADVFPNAVARPEVVYWLDYLSSYDYGIYVPDARQKQVPRSLEDTREGNCLMGIVLLNL